MKSLRLSALLAAALLLFAGCLDLGWTSLAAGLPCWLSLRLFASERWRKGLGVALSAAGKWSILAWLLAIVSVMGTFGGWPRPWQKWIVTEPIILAAEGSIALTWAMLVSVLLGNAIRLVAPRHAAPHLVPQQTLVRDVPRLLLREAVLAVWFVLAWEGNPGLDVPLWRCIVFLLALIAAIAEGEAESAPKRSVRMLLALLAVPHYGLNLLFAVMAAWNVFIERAVFQLPGALIIWIAGIAFTLLVLALVFFYTRNWLWVRRRMTGPERAWLARRADNIQFWSRWFERRHAAHSSRWVRFGHQIYGAVADMWALVLGWPALKQMFPLKPGRMEQFMRMRVVEAERKTAADDSAWRALRLRCDPNPPSDVLDRGRSLEDALTFQGRRLRLLGDLLVCPEKGCDFSLCAGYEELRALALEFDAHLVRHASLQHFGCGRGHECFAGDLRPRLQSYYEQLARKESEWNDVKHFRMKLLDPNRSEEAARLLAVAETREWLALPRREGDLVYEGLLAALLDARDWQGCIELWRQWGTTGNRPRPHARVGLGEAYFRHAFEIDPLIASPLSEWALDQAASHFYAAGARQSLEVMLMGLPQTGSL